MSTTKEKRVIRQLTPMPSDEEMARREAEAQEDAAFEAEFAERVTRALMNLDRRTKESLATENVALSMKVELYVNFLKSDFLPSAIKNSEYTNSLEETLLHLNEKIKNQKKIRQKGGYARAKNNPRHAAREPIKKEWKDWQDGKVLYKNQAHFARAMASKHGLDDNKNIESWCRTWRKERQKSTTATPT